MASDETTEEEQVRANHHEPRGRHDPLSEFETGLEMEEAIWREAEWIAMDAGTVLLEFGPKDGFQKTVAVAERNLAEFEGAPNGVR